MEVTDLAVIAEPDRVWRLAAREGRQTNVIDLHLSSGLHRQRVRLTGQDDAVRPLPGPR